MIVIEDQQLHCAICEKEIELEKAIILPNLPINRNNPLFFFNGTIVHKDCLKKHPLKIKLFKLYKTLGKYKYDKDFITKTPLNLKELGHFDNEIFTYFFTNDRTQPLYQFNCIAINKNNLSKWKDYNYFIKLLHDLDKSGEWRGNEIRLLIEKLTSPPRLPYSQHFLDKMIERYGDEFINNEKRTNNNPFKEEYYRLKKLDVFDEK